jgi:ERF superfamily protein
MDGSEVFDPHTGEIRPAATGMPAEVAKAIIAVCKRVKTLGTDTRNEHAKYDYVSIDKFMETIGPLMAEAGLVLTQDEVSAEIKEQTRTDSRTGQPVVSGWLFVRYSFVLSHVSGASTMPVYRSVALQALGPQSFGAAESYMLKRYLRGVFMVPTGDKDADDLAQDGLPGRTGARTALGWAGVTRTAEREEEEARQTSNKSAPPPKEAPPASSPDLEEAKRQHTEIRDIIDAATQPEDVDRILGSKDWERLEEIGRRASPTDHEAVIARLRARALKRKEMLAGGNMRYGEVG